MADGGSQAKPVLSITNLATSFRQGNDWTQVLNGISFDVPPSQTVAVVGESGSGKSVTALSVMQLLPGSTARVSGSVKLDGRELLGLSETQMNQVRGNEIAMIFQEPMTSLNPVMTIGFQIAEAIRIHRGLDAAAARAETVRLLEKVRIPSAASRFNDYPHLFSGGMRQRVMIAMALACQPKLLIADEPTTALDVTIQAQIIDLIRTLQREERMSVIFITHDMGVVAELADHTVVMFRGDVVEENTTEAIFANPAHPYTRRLLSAVPTLGSMRGTSAPKPFRILDVEGRPVVAAQAQRAQKKAAAGGALLEVRNLVKRFPIHRGAFARLSGHVHAVENVSFSLRAGETLSLVGESGCGKSTTGRSILRLVQPDGGKVIFDGHDVMTAGSAEMRDLRRGMQIVFQDPFASLNPRMRIGQIISEPILAHGLASAGEARDRAASLMEQVGLSPQMMSRYPHEFSGGQRQRISIARALSLDPKLIVADEAVSALDVSVKAQIINLMLELQDRLGVAYLFISHDMAVVERASHTVAVMYLGEIVEMGPRAAIFENPQHPYTRKLLAAVPVADPTRRNFRNAISNDELLSPVRPLGYNPPPRSYREVASGHLVRVA
ncbi:MULTISPECIES: ABC transporter ATP-binding protein [Chelativorans]|jgi:peptide/nickel transport system ATP-binding protein|uniref:Glutathione import ATP-binding protein GsiA n=1 Tax=Chelativorans sp. (strain BNC1) TaxID=266779 RepID=Q11C60_CHESB|nr:MULTISPECIES: ABC transporter ATP-binding protein [Chelativorans]